MPADVKVSRPPYPIDEIVIQASDDDRLIRLDVDNNDSSVFLSIEHIRGFQHGFPDGIWIWNKLDDESESVITLDDLINALQEIKASFEEQD